MAREFTMDRRAYLATIGAGTAAGLAGCTGLTGGGGGGNEVVAGTAPGFPPFEIKEEGELKGFDIDLMEAVVAETDLTFGGWQEFEFDSLIPALTSDKIDTIAAAMTINEKRKETIAFSDPYYNADQSVLVREGGDFQPSSTDDLSGHEVGAQKGTTGEGVLNGLIEDGTIKESDKKSYDNYTLGVQDLENGNVDALIVDLPVAQTFSSQRSVEVAFVIETGERYGFGVRKQDDDLESALNSGLQAVRDSGQYEEIRNKWFSSA